MILVIILRNCTSEGSERLERVEAVELTESVTPTEEEGGDRAAELLGTPNWTGRISLLCRALKQNCEY